jgi:hydrogenase nickel incorporation protein HypA/HybF
VSSGKELTASKERQLLSRFCRAQESQVHELSIAAAILDSVQAQAERHNAHISKVGIRLGELSGVDADALAFGFEALIKDTDMEPLSLEIERRPRIQKCAECECEFPAPESQTACPQCGSGATSCVGGEELDIAFMELEDE